MGKMKFVYSDVGQKDEQKEFRSFVVERDKLKKIK